MMDQNILKNYPLKLVSSFFCLFIERNLLTGTFFCKSCITNRDTSATHVLKNGNPNVGEYIFIYIFHECVLQVLVAMET